MASSSFSTFSCLFLLASPLAFLSIVNGTPYDGALPKDDAPYDGALPKDDALPKDGAPSFESVTPGGPSFETLVEDTCVRVSDKETNKVCKEYVTGLFENEIPKDGDVSSKDFTDGFFFIAATAGYEMITKLGAQMIAMANEKAELSVELQHCINSYEAATNAALAAHYSFRKKDYTKASSQMLQASNVVGKCDKPLEKEKDLLEAHKIFVQIAKLPISFIDDIKNGDSPFMHTA